MIFNKKAMDIFWIIKDGMSLREYGDIDVGETFFSALTFIDIEIAPSESTTKSLKKVDIDIYEGIGRIFDIAKDNGPTLLFDCGIYAVCHDAALPDGIISGSFVKIRFYLLFDEGYADNLRINGELLFKVIPEMQYDWRVKDILIMIEEDIGKKNFAKLPVAYTSSKGEIYKRITGTNAYEDCGENFNTSYILICEML
ncbi:hypothetical protein [Candidatus Magnetominusculus xianensis]|uniref:Uncharacterized protein n=1 Tax=Candidatus Magnetominusculus xianensis TaxID=1748249 RepID=A0ABR5SI60_9BACT|nr:hypothetical protein [Candidatus Magnetominusculus xianensis]KWT90983.1 hypothetical protein ASN18_1067 [Candidatus Magnetominusculus xianensis]MBF0403137.1 hypothetical protein [Nitrospirota bacterium]